MSREWQFNPPPNWPVPAEAPGLDWRPDPQWEPIPIGWELWRRRRTSSRRRTTAVLTGLCGLTTVLAVQLTSLAPVTAPGARPDGPHPAQASVHQIQLSDQLAVRLRTVAGTARSTRP